MKFNICGKYKTAAAAYSLFVVWACLIFLTIPLARTIQKYVSTHFGRSTFGYFTLVMICVCFLFITLYLRKRRPERLSIRNYAWLTAITGTYAYFTISLWKNPEEAVHFLEYGILSYFAYSVLTHHVKDFTLYFSASLLVLFVGTLDEILQWLVPGRYWDIRDIRFNFLGGVLLQIGIWKGFRPQSITGPATVRSIRILSVITAACLLLLGLCASNTPTRIAYYSKKISFLSYLKSNPSMMSDYGYKHSDSNIGTFFSRFTRDELHALDHQNREKYSKILNTTAAINYDKFLITYNPFKTPFLYEMRIHLFRRDHYAEAAESGKSSRVKNKKNATIAYKENLILEKYFGETLDRSRYRWSEDKKDAIRSLADTAMFYKSPVVSGLFTYFTDRQLWAFILLGLFVLGAVNHRISRKTRKN